MISFILALAMSANCDQRYSKTFSPSHMNVVYTAETKCGKIREIKQYLDIGNDGEPDMYCKNKRCRYLSAAEAEELRDDFETARSRAVERKRR